MAELSSLALSVLSVFAEGPRHAYEVYCLMRARQEESTVRLSAGSLYRAVQRMADGGLLAPLGTERDGNRPERTVYEVTEEGHRRLRLQVAQMLVARPREYPQFAVAVAEAHLLPAAEVGSQLERRVQSIDDDLETLERHAHLLEAKHLPERFWLDLSFNRSALRAEREWCAKTAADIAAGRLDWRTPPPQQPPCTPCTEPGTDTNG